MTMAAGAAAIGSGRPVVGTEAVIVAEIAEVAIGADAGRPRFRVDRAVAAVGVDMLVAVGTATERALRKSRDRLIQASVGWG